MYPILSLNLDLHNNAGESALWLALKQLDPAYLTCDDISRYDNTFAAKLIARGANTDILDPRTGSSLLHRAAQESSEAAAVFLVQHRAQPNPKNAQGEAPIHIAAKNGLHQLVEILLQHGADPNIQTALKPKPATPVPSAAAATPLSLVPVPSRQQKRMESPAQPNTAPWSMSQSRPSLSHLPPGPAPLEVQPPSPLTPPQPSAGGGMMDFDLSSSALSRLSSSDAYRFPCSSHHVLKSGLACGAAHRALSLARGQRELYKPNSWLRPLLTAHHRLARSRREAVHVPIFTGHASCTLRAPPPHGWMIIRSA